MAKRIVDFPVFDADNHMYEKTDAFTKFLPPEYSGLIKYVEVNGRTKIAVRNVISDYIPNPTFNVVGRPGASEELFKHGNPEGKTRRELMGDPIRSPEAFFSPEPRLALMDELGIDRALMWPTLASLLEERLSADPRATHVVVHALNQWMHEHWSFNYEGRIFPTPVITLPIVSEAIKELEWVYERGAKIILIRPAPVPGKLGTRSPGLPEFDRFWAKVNESGIFVSLHVSESGYSKVTQWWGSMTGGAGFSDGDPLRSCIDNVSRAIEDMLSALIGHGVMRRFPNIRWVSAENGSLWVEHLVKVLKRAYVQMPQAFGRIDPVETLHEKVFVEPFYEEDLDELKEYMPAERILFGSDWPHMEGVVRPLDFLDSVKTFNAADQRRIMRDNAAELTAAANS